MSHNLKGGWDLSNKYKTILSFNFETDDWNEEGNMLVGRSGHDITVVNSEDFKKWCKPTKSKSAESQSANRIGYKCQPRVSQPRVNEESAKSQSTKSHPRVSQESA